jgi:hypothetical protein
LKYKEKFRAHMASAIEAEPSISRDADVEKQETLTPVATA